MTKILLNLVLALAILGASMEAVAQRGDALVVRQAKLQALAEALRKRDDLDRRDVEEYAFRMGIPVRRELPDDRVLELQRIAPGIGPVFYITNNVDAADTVSTDEVWPGGSTGLDLDGSGMTVGEWDGGAVFAEHPEFAGRLTQVDGATLVSNHSTHVAGTLIGSGDWLLPEARGMAFAAYLDAYDWNSDTAEMALAASNGLLISNHSYGIAAGWLYIGDAPPDRWWWIGGDDPADVEDANFGYYDSEAHLWDQIALDAPNYLIVRAAGNDRSDTGPVPGEEYTVIDQDGNFLFTSTLPRNADCAPAGYDCIASASVAKNILTVGAVDDLLGGYSPLSGPSSVQMSDFSGWGPTDDGRIKPDVVGNGVLLLSAWGDYPYYAAAIGTSMAAPNVTGSLLLLQELYEIDPEGPYAPATMQYDGSTGYYSSAVTTSGNAFTVVGRFALDSFSGNEVEYFGRILSDTYKVRLSIAAISADYAGLPNRWNRLQFYVTDPTGNPLALIFSSDTHFDGELHTFLFSYDGDAGTATLIVDGVDDEDAGNGDRILTTGTVGAGSGLMGLGATEGGASSWSGEIGYFGYRDAYLTNGSDFMDTAGNPKELDESGWTEWGAQPLFWNADGNMESNRGWAGNMARNGTITRVSYASGTGIFMRAATLKALAIHTADEAGDSPGPDYEFGWGLLNTKTAAEVISDNGNAHQIIEDSLPNGALNAHEIVVTNDSAKITATLVWADPPGTPVALSLDPPDLMLVNDLDLRISRGPSTFMPWVLNPEQPAVAATTGDNFRDNVEQVVIDGAEPGTYFIQVGHKGSLLNGDAQDYSVIISVEPTLPSNSTILIGEGFSGGLPTGWSVDTASGVSWTLNAPVPGDNRLDNLTGGVGNFFMVDNNFSHITESSLLTRSFDLSAAEALVLRFKSRFSFDTFETINVDTSADGGGSWTTVWQFSGFNPVATTYVLDLTGVGAGQPNFKLRFRYDSEGEIQGDFWQIDDVELEAFGDVAPPGNLPDRASDPVPADNATSVSINSALGWTAGSGADSHNVYFGTSSPPELQGSVVGTYFDPGSLNPSTTYYWRIDEVNSAGTTTGIEWSFTTEGGPAGDFAPDTMQYDGSTGYYSSAVTTSGNAFTVVGRFALDSFSGNEVEYFGRILSDTYKVRLSIAAISADYAGLPNRWNRLQFYVTDPTGNPLALIFSSDTHFDGELHTFLFSYDGDAGTATLIVDGVDDEDAGNGDRILTTGTVGAGSGLMGLGATEGGASSWSGEIGYFGYRDAYLTNGSDFMDTAGNPKELDESGWTEWGAQPLFWNADGNMEDNRGSAGNMIKHGMITRVYYPPGSGAYMPATMQYDGSTGYYSSAVTTSGNAFTVVGRFALDSFSGNEVEYFGRILSDTYKVRLSIAAISADYAGLPNRWNRLQFYVTDPTGNPLALIFSSDTHFDGELHTFLFSYDGDAGTATLIVDGVDDEDAGNGDRILTTGTVGAGSGLMGLGATEGGASSWSGEIGYFGYRDAYLTNGSDFMDTAGNPKELDESGWTEWGAQPLFWNADGNMEDNRGSAGNMIKHGMITRVDY